MFGKWVGWFKKNKGKSVAGNPGESVSIYGPEIPPEVFSSPGPKGLQQPGIIFKGIKTCLSSDDLIQRIGKEVRLEGLGPAQRVPQPEAKPRTEEGRA